MCVIPTFAVSSSAEGRIWTTAGLFSIVYQFVGLYSDVSARILKISFPAAFRTASRSPLDFSIGVGRSAGLSADWA